MSAQRKLIRNENRRIEKEAQKEARKEAQKCFYERLNSEDKEKYIDLQDRLIAATICQSWIPEEEYPDEYAFYSTVISAIVKKMNVIKERGSTQCQQKEK